MISEHVSEWKPVLSGVPEDSVLSRLLFIILVNDVPCLDEHILKFFADDSQLQGIIRNISFNETI